MALTNITIIGGGACGISAFIELFLQLRIAGLHRKTSITIIEENQEVGKGLAFGTRQPGHILNTQADLMGIHFTEPEHFSEWLIEHQQRVGEEVVDNEGENRAFTTRRLYGDYLKEQFEHYFKIAREEGMQVEVVRGRATQVTRKESGFEIQLADNTPQQCDYLLLAPGTPVANNYPDLDGIKNYFDSPWPSEPLLRQIDKHEDVAILGSSLSAIDAIMSLADNGHTGKITCYSPDGLMPRVQPEEQVPWRCQFITLRNLHQIQRTELRNPTVKEMFRLFMKEVENYAGTAIDWKATKRTGVPADELLKADIATAKSGGDGLIVIPYALRYESSQMWKWLDDDEKIKFKKWLGSYWSINRHCMPLVNAERVHALFEQKQLRVVPDLRQVTYDREKQGFELQFGEDKTIEKYLINATGPASSVRMMKSELMQNLAASGLIEPVEAGGINVSTETMQIAVGGKLYDNFYAAGHITNGLLLDVNAVWFNVKQIGNLCRHLTSQIILGNAA